MTASQYITHVDGPLRLHGHENARHMQLEITTNTTIGIRNSSSVLWSLTLTICTYVPERMVTWNWFSKSPMQVQYRAVLVWLLANMLYHDNGYSFCIYVVPFGRCPDYSALGLGVSGYIRFTKLCCCVDTWASLNSKTSKSYLWQRIISGNMHPRTLFCIALTSCIAYAAAVPIANGGEAPKQCYRSEDWHESQLTEHLKMALSTPIIVLRPVRGPQCFHYTDDNRC